MQTRTQVARVIAGTLPSSLTLRMPQNKSYEILVPTGFFATKLAYLDLTNCESASIVDIDDPKHASRKSKIQRTPGTLLNVLLLIKTPNSIKYAAVISCANCSIPVRCFTSDLHQTCTCSKCTQQIKNFIHEMQRALAHTIRNSNKPN